MLDDVGSAALLLLAKIAHADGRIDPLEKELLVDFSSEINIICDFDALALKAKHITTGKLCKVITSEADRFFIRLRCHLMVHIDGEVATDEQAVLDQVIENLPLSGELEILLDQALDHQLANGKEPDMSSIYGLYSSSSFA